jgi:hypothetical protein
MRARSALIPLLALACACTGGLGEVPGALPNDPGDPAGTGMPPTAPPPGGDGAPRVSGGCVITGCNDQLCSDHLISTDCAPHPQDACFHEATCERSAGGACGWRSSDALHACLARAAGMPPPAGGGAGMVGTGSGIASDAGVPPADERPPPPGGAPPTGGGTTGGCSQGGCFGEVCAEHIIDSAECTWSNEYACYYASTCARQADGDCGWTPTADMTSCLEFTRMLGGGIPGG